MQKKIRSHVLASGFTLIELMITIVIAAILAAIAIPSYQSYIKKSQLRAAQNDLVALSLVFENYYQRNLSYPNVDYADTNALIASTAFPQWSPSKKEIFEFSSAKVNAGKGYELLATAKSSSNLNGCILKITNTNTRTATTSCEGKTSW
uniref:type IV pilin protein n=1 Tax=Acinetobacter sp. A7.4 TaxID=2919921 RepID=UPI00247B04D9|nr:type IV pilin protein [Acinetobacter sp. A7.4]